MKNPPQLRGAKALGRDGAAERYITTRIVENDIGPG
jgi:hypothetical protein